MKRPDVVRGVPVRGAEGLACVLRPIRLMRNQSHNDTDPGLQRDTDEWKTDGDPMTDAQRRPSKDCAVRRAKSSTKHSEGRRVQAERRAPRSVAAFCKRMICARGADDKEDGREESMAYQPAIMRSRSF
jgi:hypothetical protein